MARDHARVNVAIWGDPDFRGLPQQAQHLYLLLWSSPGLTYCGTHDWRPARLAGLAGGWTREDVEAAGACLAARYFVVIDDEREEILLRSWIRFDGLMKQPRMAVSCVTAYAETASDLIRSVVVSELRRVHEETPSLACWTDRRVAEVLEHPAAEPKGWPTPEDPFGDGFTPGFTPGLAQTYPLGLGSVSGRATPSPSPAPYSLLLPGSEEVQRSSGSKPSRPAQPDTFEAWWNTWPRKEAKAKAQAAYAKALKAIDAEKLALLTAEWFEARPDLEPKFIPLPASWLNARRWEDERPARPATPAASPSNWDRLPTAAELRARRQAGEA